MLSSLTTFGPKLIDYLEGTKTATQFASVYVEYTKFIDCRDGPSPSSVPTNLDLSIFDLLLNPASCSSRSTVSFPVPILERVLFRQLWTKWQFLRTTSSTSSIAATAEWPHPLLTSSCPFERFTSCLHLTRCPYLLPPQIEFQLKLVQYNFVDYSVAKAVFTKHEKEQNHEILMDLLSKQTIDGAPDSL